MESINEAPMSRQELAEVARARAAFSVFLNVHFTTLPDPEFVGRVRDRQFTDALDTLAGDGSSTGVADGATLMRGFISASLATDTAELSQTLGIDRTRLYRGVSPEYGPPPPCEVVWDARVTDTSAALKALADIYVGAGMGMAAEARERLDYIGVELEFLRMLAVRELEAWEANQPDQAKLALRQQADFVRDHLGHWVPAFIERALKDARTDFYCGHLLMLRGFLGGEKERLEALVESLQE